MDSGRLRGANARGYTLAEILVAAAVVSLLVAIGIPFATSYVRASTLRAGAQELVAIMNGARQLAITRNTSVCVSVASTRAVYRVAATNPCSAPPFVGAGTNSDGSIPLQNGVQIIANTANVVFSPLGAAAPAASYTVRTATGPQTLNVLVSTVGRVTIQ
jgi:prepilin-type N-terminal cleavage/methylation domain-containing protein